MVEGEEGEGGRWGWGGGKRKKLVDLITRWVGHYHQRTIVNGSFSKGTPQGGHKDPPKSLG